jgi:peptidoglycan/xylan/chitin deacetylase (PgdA/CDA1 family)
MDRRTVLGMAAAALGLAVSGCDSSTGSAPNATATAAGATPTGSPAPPTSAPPTLPVLPAEITNGPRERPNIALTFHGQGDPKVAEQLLAELERGGARVTVLAVGTWLQAQPTLARRILDGGHELGNHTQNHLDIEQMSSTQALYEVDACAQTLKRLTGSIGTWFRPSQTAHANAMVRSEAKKIGYQTCLSYDVDSLDFIDPGAANVVRNILTPVRNGSIVSMHFGHPGTVTAVPALLDGLRQKGLRAVTMTELMSA